MAVLLILLSDVTIGDRAVRAGGRVPPAPHSDTPVTVPVTARDGSEPKSIAIPTLKLPGGGLIPQIGFGTWKVSDGGVFASALRVGYRHFDTARAYGNEAVLGRVFSQAMADGVISSRADLFITTKIHSQYYDGDVVALLANQLRELNTSYADVILLHDPGNGAWRKAWPQLEQAKAKGMAKAIGVSNFDVASLESLRTLATQPVEVVQNFATPQRSDAAVRRWCATNGAAFEAFSLFGSDRAREFFAQPVLVDLARRAGRTVPQLLLGWAIGVGVVALPRATSEAHQRANLEAAALPPLTAEILADLAALDGSR